MAFWTLYPLQLLSMYFLSPYQTTIPLSYLHFIKAFRLFLSSLSSESFTSKKEYTIEEEKYSESDQQRKQNNKFVITKIDRLYIFHSWDLVVVRMVPDQT